jgi:hypothetical protein
VLERADADGNLVNFSGMARFRGRTQIRHHSAA